MKTKNISEFSYLIITKKNMEGELEFEPLLYEEEFKNFDQTLDQNLTRFNKVNEEVDKFEADNYINSNIENLDEALQSLIRSQANKDKISATLEKERTHIDDTIREIGDILSQRDSSSKMLAKANEDIMKKKRELSQHQNQTTSSRDLIEEKKGKLGLEMEKWKETLGLDLVLSTHGGIIFNFTNVKREDSQRRFMCEIKGKDYIKILFDPNSYLFPVVDRVYRVENCNPKVQEIDAMVEVLNQTNDLSGFAVTLRKKFSQSC